MENINESIEKWKYLIPITLKKMYGNPYTYAKSKRITYDDLFQFALTGLWEGIKTWREENKGKERNWMIRNIKWRVRKSVLEEQKNFFYYKTYDNKYKDKNYEVPLLSMSQKLESERDIDFYDTVSCDNIFHYQEDDMIETKILANEEYSTVLSLLNEKEKEVILMRLQGMSYQEIANKLNVTKQCIGLRMKKVQNKVERYRRIMV